MFFNLNSAIIRAPRTLREVQIQGGSRILAQVYCCWYIEHEIREADPVDVFVSTFECRIVMRLDCMTLQNLIPALLDQHGHNQEQFSQTP